MADVAVNNSTIRVLVENDKHLTRLTKTYGDYVAIIHHGDGKQMVVYDSHALLEQVIEQCLDDSPHWTARFGCSN